MRIDVEQVRSVLSEYRRLQQLDPAQVELYEAGVKVEVPQLCLDHWQTVGLGFCDFVDFEAYKLETIAGEGTENA